MTGRERLLSVIGGKRPDRLAWTMLIDGGTRLGMAEEHRALDDLALGRLAGCDLMPFGTWRNPGKIVFPGVEEIWERRGEVSVRTTRTRWGELTAEFKNGHPLRLPVRSQADFDVYRRMWSSAEVQYDPQSKEIDRGMRDALGGDGICVCTTQPSPVQHLLETEMGAQFFYTMLYDEPGLMEALLGEMHVRYCAMYALNAAHSPWEVHIPVENTSTSYISPAIYRRYSVPQLSEYIGILHRAGKTVLVHMCGLLKGLLPFFPETGMDGIHAVTESPVGDVSFDLVLDALGEDVVMMGLMRGNTFTGPSATKEQVWRLLDEIYTPRLRRANFILCAAADGLPLPMDRFLWVGEWMDKYGGD